ncbi:MAG: hypothetical protein DRH08_10570 [Deltaproteobacteria bacterium]|nr:MAG: hypothetical protein DRH08_10570 [Deltaproteobacteria bacterium]
MADLRYTIEDVVQRVQSEMKRIARAPANIKRKWLEARKQEVVAKISSKEQEIIMIKKIRLADLEVELAMLQIDLEALEKVQEHIQTVGIEYLEQEKVLEIDNK